MSEFCDDICLGCARSVLSPQEGDEPPTRCRECQARWDSLSAAAQHRLRDVPLCYLALLPDRERRVLELRYGLSGDKPRSLDYLGLALGVTRERIRQLEHQGMRRLKAARQADTRPTRRAEVPQPAWVCFARLLRDQGFDCARIARRLGVDVRAVELVAQ